MHLTKKLSAAAAVLLVSAGVAVAGISPVSGTYSGTVHNTKFVVTATLDKGKLTAIKGEGGSGVFIPYNPKLSNAESCGDANSFDSSASGDTWTFSGHVNKKDRFSFTATDKFHTMVTLKGHLSSDEKTATGKFRFYQSHLPHFDKKKGKVTQAGHCDSGEMKIDLTKGS